MSRAKTVVPIGKIEKRILLIRGEKVIVDADLAAFYGVTTKRLNEQLKRNLPRFPDDFMFQLTEMEKSELVANCDHLANLKYSSFPPSVFTEHGAIMAATVLNSPRAVEVGVWIVRAFANLRKLLADNRIFSRKPDAMERRLSEHDGEILAIIDSLRQLSAPGPVPPQRRIGFMVES